MQVQLNPTITQQQSTILMKKLVQASIGSISYIRMLFPDNAFSTKGMDGIAVKYQIITRVVNNDLMNKYMNGIFDAMEKKYLKTVVFGIYEQNNDDKLIESYEFNFDYDNSEFSLNDSIVSVQKNTRMFMKRLLVMTQNLEPLPDTPWDYEPPMFQPGPPIVLPKDGNKLDIGKVKTGFHEIDLVVLTESRVVSVVDEKVTEEVMTQSQRLVEDRCNDESDIGNVQSPAVKNPSDEDDYVPLRSDSTQSEIILENGKILRALASKKQSSGGSEHPKELTANNEQLDAEPAKNTTHMPEMVILAPTSIVIPEIQQDGKIDCICKSLSELGNLVQCDQCLSWCHLTCFGYKSAEDPELPASFKCHQCSSGLISNEDLYDLAIKRKILASVIQGFKSFRSLYDGVGLPSDSWAIRDKYRKWLESFGCVKALPKRKFDVQVEENLLQEFLNPKLNYLNKPQAGKQKVSIVSKDLVVTNA